MAIAEIIIPQLRQDGETKAGFEKIWPRMSEILGSLPTVTLGFGGWVISRDEKDLTDEWQFLIAEEWISQQDFVNFTKSPEFGGFVKPLLALVTGPPLLEVYQTDTSTSAAMAAPVTEIFRIQLADESLQSVVKEAWTAFTSALVNKNASIKASSGHMLMGSSHPMFLGEIGWPGLQVRKGILSDSDILELKTKIQNIGKAITYVVKLEPFKIQK